MIGCDGYRAQFLGSFGLWRSDGEAVTPRGRRARALLAYLMLTPQRMAARERLAALLWSDRADEQARASLRQVLFEMRDIKRQGELLEVDRAAVRLAALKLETDLDAFDRAAGVGDAAKLATLLEPGAVLLDDLDGISSAFDEWLAGLRERARAERRARALAVCRQASGGGNASATYALARALVADDPLDETATVVAMEAAHANGDPGTMRKLFSALEDALHRDLQTAASSTTREAHERLLRQPVWVEARAPHPLPHLPPRALLPVTPAIAAAPAGHDARGVAGKPRRARWPLAAAMSTALAAAAVLGAVLLRGNRAAPSQAVVLVEPIEATRDDRPAQALGDGIATVVARDLVGTSTAAQIIAGGSPRAVSPKLFLHSTAITTAGLVHANVQLLSAPERSVVWSSDFSRATGEVDQMIQQVSLQVAREVHCAYANGRAAIFTADPETARLLLASCDAVGTDFDESARYGVQVTRRVPMFARGWSEYAAAVAMAAQSLPPRAQPAAYARATVAADHAIALDPHQGLAYFAIAQGYRGLDHWIERDRLVGKGLRAEPENPEVLAMRAGDLSNIGRFQDAIDVMRHSFAVDHFLPGKLSQLGGLEADVGDLDQAKAMLARGEALWPNHPWFNDLAFSLAYFWGDPAEAKRLLATRSDSVGAQRVLDDAFLAWRAAPAPATSAAVAEAARALVAGGRADIRLVQHLAAIGRIDDAYRLADRLPRSTDAGSSWFRDYLAPFRADPRFMTLAARIGFAAIWQKTGLWPDFCSEPTLRYDCRSAARLALARIGRRTA